MTLTCTPSKAHGKYYRAVKTLQSDPEIDPETMQTIILLNQMVLHYLELLLAAEHIVLLRNRRKAMKGQETENLLHQVLRCQNSLHHQGWHVLSNGNKTEWSPIRSVIIRRNDNKMRTTAQRWFINVLGNHGRHEVLLAINHKKIQFLRKEK